MKIRVYARRPPLFMKNRKNSCKESGTDGLAAGSSVIEWPEHVVLFKIFSRGPGIVHDDGSPLLMHVSTFAPFSSALMTTSTPPLANDVLPRPHRFLISIRARLGELNHRLERLGLGISIHPL